MITLIKENIDMDKRMKPAFEFTLFNECHGTIDWKHVIPLKKKDEFKAYQLADYLKIDVDHLWFNKRGFLYSVFYFDGLFYFDFMGLADLGALMALDKAAKKVKNNGGTFIGMSKDKLTRTADRFRSIKEKGDYVLLCDIVDKKVALKVFCDIYNEIPDEQKWDAYVALHTGVETGFESVPKRIYKDLFTKQYKKSKKREDRLRTLKAIASLCKGEKLTIYHGYNGGAYDPHDDMSWTLSRQTAEFFANRFHVKGEIIEKKIDLSEVIDFITSRGENEILLTPKL